jgi:hypothetical protein
MQWILLHSAPLQQTHGYSNADAQFVWFSLQLDIQGQSLIDKSSSVNCVFSITMISVNQIVKPALFIFRIARMLNAYFFGYLTLDRPLIITDISWHVCTLF